MKGKTFLLLLIAAGVLGGLWLLRMGGQEPAGALKMGDKLFTDLSVNAVASVTIADSENKVTLIKGDKVWQVEERSGFPADFDELSNTVVKLSRLKIGRSFAGSPESLARLALIAPSVADASEKGKQITLKDLSGKVLAEVILGQARKSDSGGDGGQYLKRSDTDTVFLVDGNFQFLKTAPADWLKKEILDIKPDNVAAVTCYQGDGQTPVYTLSRPGKGEPALMTPVPAGRTADPDKIEQVFDALAPLTLDDVQAGSGKPTTAEPDRFRLVYRLYDGRQISLFPEFDGKSRYTLRIAAEEANAGPDASADDSPEPETKDDNAPEEASAKADAGAPAPRTVQQINQELNPWVFSVKKWQFDSLITQSASLLEEEKKEGDGTS